ncbi:hypothetical protein C8R47DRAFT_1134446 [Mycena vitilis]|nr:hypothetical protein C8R47DRAFT_1134446 [Mycena vitilis]
MDQDHVNSVDQQLFEISNPRLTDLLRLNASPLDGERVAINGSMAIARSRLAQLETKAPDDPYASDKTLLRRYIAKYSSLLAPIRLLAADVLQIILSHPDMHESTRMGPLVVTMYRPMVIAAVCSHWRDIVLGTPQLWSTLQVKLWGGYTALHWIRLCLERSKNAPLTLNFHWVRGYNVDPIKRHNQVFEETMGELARHAERWQHVALPSSEDFLTHSSLAQDRFPRLETLEFHRLFPEQKELRIFVNTPRLQFLSIQESGNISELPALPWGQLTCVSAPDAFTVPLLVRAPQLRGIVICMGRSASQPVLPQPSLLPTRCESMRTIVLSGGRSQNRALMKILLHIVTPRLTELFLVDCAAWDAASIPTILQRSGCYLKTLLLQDTRVRARELFELLPSLQTVETLVVADCIPNALNNSVLEALTLLSGTDAVLPALRTFVLTGSYLFTLEKLLTMLESRTGSHSQSLVTIDIVLLDRGFTVTELNRFVGLRGLESSRLRCLDQARRPVRFTSGNMGPREWRWTERSSLSSVALCM